MSSRLRQFAAPVTVLAQQGLAQQQVVLLLCCVMHAIHDGYTSAMYLLLPLIATDLQLSYAQVGFLKTLISGGQSLFQLPGGIIAERVGERRMLALGLATLSGAFLLLSPAWSFPTVAIALSAHRGRRQSAASTVLLPGLASLRSSGSAHRHGHLQLRRGRRQGRLPGTVERDDSGVELARIGRAPRSLRTCGGTGGLDGRQVP